MDDIGGERTLLFTHAGLCMLLLVFFVMLFALSGIDATRFEESFGAVRSAMGGDAGDMPRVQARDAEDARDKLRRQLLEAQTRSCNAVRSFVAQNGLEDVVGVTQEEGGIILRLPVDLLFASGSDAVLPEGLKTLQPLKDIFVMQREQNINIRCFTDDTPPSAGERFRDNWELSSLRAVHILRHLLAQGIEPGRLTATGFGGLEPLFPNTTEENRAGNRRVEFVLERRMHRD